MDYALSEPLHLLASVQHVRYSAADDISGKKPKITQLNLGVNYWLSKRTDLYSFFSYAKGQQWFACRCMGLCIAIIEW